MADEPEKTIRIQRNAKVGTDSRGRTVWTKPIETVELELVSTQMLEQLIESGDQERTQKIRALAEGNDGVLARDISNNEFEILRDEDLEAALQAANRDAAKPTPPDFALDRVDEAGDDEALTLVTTQYLRKMLAGKGADGSEEGDAPDGAGGYNPYDNG